MQKIDVLLFQMHSKAIQGNLWSDRFLSVTFGGESQMGQTFKQTNKMARTTDCDDDTSQSCQVTPTIRNVHDQLESLRTV